MALPKGGPRGGRRRGPPAFWTMVRPSDHGTRMSREGSGVRPIRTAGRSDPVPNPKPVVGIPCSLRGGGRAVAAEHLPGLPTRQQHQVAFVAAFRQILVSEGVPELMRVEAGDAGLDAAALHHPPEPAVGEPAPDA